MRQIKIISIDYKSIIGRYGDSGFIIKKEDEIVSIYLQLKGPKRLHLTFIRNVKAILKQFPGVEVYTGEVWYDRLVFKDRLQRCQGTELKCDFEKLRVNVQVTV